jgi:hypothetical protein
VSRTSEHIADLLVQMYTEKALGNGAPYRIEHVDLREVGGGMARLEDSTRDEIIAAMILRGFHAISAPDGGLIVFKVHGFPCLESSAVREFLAVTGPSLATRQRRERRRAKAARKTS